MIRATTIPIFAAVTEAEEGIVQAAADHLAGALRQATGEPWHCGCRFLPDLSALTEAPKGAILIVSLLLQLERCSRPWADVEAELRKHCGALGERGEPLMLCTVFRHVGGAESPSRVAQLRICIGRLNLLATELSRCLGAFVIDLDRVLADFGARRLETDYRLRGASAADVAGKAMALVIAANALDALVPIDAQVKARSIIAAYQPRVGAPPELSIPNLIMILGRGRRKQRVSTVTDATQANHAAWLIRQVILGRIGLGQAAVRIALATRRRGAKEMVGLFVSGLGRLVGRS